MSSAFPPEPKPVALLNPPSQISRHQHFFTPIQPTPRKDDVSSDSAENTSATSTHDDSINQLVCDESMLKPDESFDHNTLKCKAGDLQKQEQRATQCTEAKSGATSKRKMAEPCEASEGKRQRIDDRCDAGDQRATTNDNEQLTANDYKRKFQENRARFSPKVSDPSRMVDAPVHAQRHDAREAVVKRIASSSLGSDLAQIKAKLKGAKCATTKGGALKADSCDAFTPNSDMVLTSTPAKSPKKTIATPASRKKTSPRRL